MKSKSPINIILLSLFVLVSCFLILQLFSLGKSTGETYYYINSALISIIISLIFFLTISKRIFYTNPFKTSLLFFVIIIITLLVILRETGWPFNHEMGSFYYRTLIYSDHLKQLDIFPIWSSSDGFGMGTPLPMFYHRIFYMVSSSLFLVFDSLKISISITIGVFLYMGVIGMYKVCKQLGLEEKSSLIISLMYIFMNYTFTLWLVRGAMAEFTALMIIPYLILWCVRLLMEGKFSVSISIILSLLFYCHNITAIFASVLILITIGIIVLFKRTYINKTFIKKIILSVLLLIGILSPLLITMTKVLPDYNPSSITSYVYTPKFQIREPTLYFWDNYTWGNDWTEMTVKLDTPVLLLILIFTFVIIIKQRSPKNIKDKNIIILLIFSSITLILFFYLQLKSSLWVYSLLNFLNFIQFPWRLISILSPILLLIVAIQLQILKSFKNLRIILVTVCLIAMIILSPLTQSLKYEKIQNSDIISDYKTSDIYGIKGRLLGVGEYLPKFNSLSLVDTSVNNLIEYYNRLKAKGVELVDSSANCIFSTIESKYVDTLVAKFVINCEKEAIIILPINYSSLHKAYITDSSKETRRIKIEKNPKDSRILFHSPSGEYILLLQYPILLDTKIE